MKTIVLAHYYTEPQVQEMADFVGDSLDLSLRAKEADADRIVFAGVRFMAETAKILNPQSEVILPNSGSTCSLVTQVNSQVLAPHGVPALHDYIQKLRNEYILGSETTVVTYINSSADLKAISDIIVTSANVEDIVSNEIEKGFNVYFTPDRNMGAYLLSQHPEWKGKFDYWKGAVCEVHDKFKVDEIAKVMNQWTDGSKYLLAHPESPLPVLKASDFVGSTRKMLEWVKNHESKRSTIYVATEDGLLHNMRDARPDLDIRLAPLYTGCQCNSCPYMKKNTEGSLVSAIMGYGGEKIVLNEEVMNAARLPIKRMLSYE